MKALSLTPVKLLQNPKFCLGGITIGLTALHSILSWRLLSDADRVILNVLFWGAIISLLWRKRNILSLESDICSSFLGFLLVTLVLFKSFTLFWFESSFLKLAPLLLVFGLGLLASGLKGLKQYWRELTILLLLCLPDISQLIQELFKVTILTAKFAIFFLWYLGFEASGVGANVILPNGSVWVDTPCTGITTGMFLLKLAVVFMLMFPSDWCKRILVLLGSVFIAFTMSGMRVALMAVFVSDRAAFDYWHGGAGNQIFSTISILIFGLFCRFLLHSVESTRPDSAELQQL